MAAYTAILSGDTANGPLLVKVCELPGFLQDWRFTDFFDVLYNENADISDVHIRV
jgi:hypothetical protein